jgi:hypothetical protein
MANLEPISDEDLDLKEKFLGGEVKASGENSSKGEKALGMQEIKNEQTGKEKPVKMEEHAVEKEKTYSKILRKMRTSQSSAQNSQKDEVEKDAADAATADSAVNKIDKLVKLAMLKGVVHAVKVAKHLDDNYTLDEFHDKLMAEEFHQALVDKGVIREL